MSLVTFEIGTAPHLADSAQIERTPHFDRVNALETAIYRAALLGRYGKPPEASRLFVGTSVQPTGVYREVKVTYDSTNPEATSYATEVGDGLAYWEHACFTPPVAHARNGALVLFSVDTVDDAIANAIVGAHCVLASANAELGHLVIDNLTRAFPSLAARARIELRRFQPATA